MRLQVLLYSIVEVIKMKQILSCRTASEFYSYSQAYFRKLISNNTVAYHKLGYSVRFYKSDLDAHFSSKKGA